MFHICSLRKNALRPRGMKCWDLRNTFMSTNKNGEAGTDAPITTTPQCFIPRVGGWQLLVITIINVFKFYINTTLNRYSITTQKIKS